MNAEQRAMYARLIEYAAAIAWSGAGQIAQDIRVVLNDAARYWHLRDDSNPDLCAYYLASDEPRDDFDIAGAVDKQITTDIANVEARKRRT